MTQPNVNIYPILGAYDSINYVMANTVANSCTKQQQYDNTYKQYKNRDNRENGQNIKQNRWNGQNRKYKIDNRLSMIGQSGIQISTIECIISQSLNILKIQRKHQTLISKQNQLIRILLQLIPVSIPIIIVKSSHQSLSIKQQSLSPTSATSPSGHILHNSIISNFIQYYMQLYGLLKQIKQSYSAAIKDEIKKNYNRGIEDSIKSINNMINNINILSIHMHINNSSNNNNNNNNSNTNNSNVVNVNNNEQLVWLLQMLKNMVRIVQYVHTKISQDVYKLINIFNTLVLNFGSGSTSGNMTTSQITSICVSIYAQSYNLYNNNFSQILLSRFKILKSIIDTLAHLSTSAITSKLLSAYPFYKSYYYNNNNMTMSQYNKMPSISKIYSNTYIQQLTHKLYYNQYILHKSSHLLIQVNSYLKVSNYYIIGILFTIYQNLLPLLLLKQSSVPLYLYTHIILNNLKRIMQQNNLKHNLTGTSPSSPSPSTPLLNNSNINNITIPQLHIHIQSQTSTSSSSTLAQFNKLVLLQTLLMQISNVFNITQLQYFLKLYDWNFMEEDICLYSIKCLYQFIENTDNQNRIQYQLFKKCLAVINKRIQLFLQNNQDCNKLNTNEKKQNQNKMKQQSQKTIPIKYKPASRQRKQFYELKKKQYLQMVQRMNKKPKQIFKTINQLNTNGHQQMKQDYIQKVVRILKKSKDIQHRAMIDIVASNTPQSLQILQKYIQAFLKPTNLLSKPTSSLSSSSQLSLTSASSNSNLQHYLRYIISNFFLTGQAQQIVRFIDKVTSQYYKHQSPNNNIFKHSDAVYTFANAIIILNTDQHNPKNIDKKMNVQAFIKMCDKINAGEDLAPQIIKQTFKNIKQSEIHTFRNRYNMDKISLQCWMDIVGQYQSVGIGYYDDDMADISMEYTQGQESGQNDGENTQMREKHINNGFREYANQLLLSVIDQKQTQKLQVMVQRFEYDDRKFDCQIIQKIRVMIVNKKHIAMHILQKIYEQANFATKKIDEKMLSYCWLAAGIIQNFYEAIPYSKITQYLLKTWKIGFQLRDNLAIRQNLQLKTIKKYLKEYKKKQSKKSIMDMFSKFLTSKQSQSSQQAQVQTSGGQSTSSSGIRKKANILNCSFTVFKILMKNNDSRTRAAQTILLSLRHQQSRRFQQFISCLYLIFHLIYGQSNGRMGSSEQISLKQNNNNQISYQCMQIILNLLYDFYNISQSHQIGSRITSLKNKNIQKHDLVFAYSQYWTLKILFTWVISCFNQDKNQQSLDDQNRTKTIQKLKTIYNKCQSFITKINSTILTEFMTILDVQGMSYQDMIKKYGIPKQILIGLRAAVQTFDLKLKYLQKQEKPVPSRKAQSQSSKTQGSDNFEQVQKYMKQLKMSTSKSETQTKTNILKSQGKIQQQTGQENGGLKQEEDIVQKMKQQLGLISQIKVDDKKEEPLVQKKEQQKVQEKESNLLKLENQNQVSNNQSKDKLPQKNNQQNQKKKQLKAEPIVEPINKIEENEQKQIIEPPKQQQKIQANKNVQVTQNVNQNSKNEEQKKSSSSNEQLGFPIYML